MLDGRTTVWAAAALFAVTALPEWTWHATASPASEWRPCRATMTGGRPRYDETVKSAAMDEDETDDGEQHYDRDEDDGGLVEDEYGPPPPSRPLVAVADDKSKRGVRVLNAVADNRLHGKPFGRPPYPGNGLRMDTSLLRGETVELPTYVNVPVTLRCKFVPLDGTDDNNKFETVVEAMYPGHADTPPPAPDSHASRILKQLMGSADEWRDVVTKSTRPVRRVVDNYYGFRAAEPPPPVADHGRLRFDASGRHVAVRQRAAERLQRFYDARPDHYYYHRRSQVEQQPDVVEEDNEPLSESEQSEDRSAEEPIQVENQLINDRKTERFDGDDDQRVNRVDDRTAEEVDDRRVYGEVPHERLHSAMSENNTTVEPDYTILGNAVSTFTENGVTTQSA